MAVADSLWERALRVIPGGVNSPVRAMKAVGLTPVFIRRGYGCRVEDTNGRSYIDYVASWGPLIVGHAHPEVVAAVAKAAEQGTSFGAPTRAEVEFAELVVNRVGSVEKLRLVNSGTEATMSALRLARAWTKRELVVKFDGCYHGHSDGLLVAAGSGLATLGIPSSPGVPSATARTTLSLPYNNLEAVEETFRVRGEEIAAVIVEPVAGNMGVVPPREGFLEGLRRLCDDYGAVLVFDEVITGFRVAPGGAQELYGVTPDLTCLGKIIGGGLPVGAYGGRADIMDMVAPQGPVYQAGTLSGNPLATAAGLATLKMLTPQAYERLEALSTRLFEGMNELFSAAGIPWCANRVGSMMCWFFTEGPVVDYASASASDTGLFARWYKAMLEEGIYLAPSQFEATFVGLAHDEQAIDATLEAASRALKRL